MSKTDYREKVKPSPTSNDEIQDFTKDEFRGRRKPNQKKTDYERKEKKLDNWN